MLENQSVAFVGSGTMAEAIIKAILDHNLVPQHQITGSDPRTDRGEELAARYGIHVTADNTAAVSQANIVILAVKPQTLPHVLPELRGKIPASAIVLSIVAGVNIGTLVDGLAHREVVRCMPNTPAQIGQGMAVWMATPETTAEQQEWVQSILQAMGSEVRVYEEKQLDMATAVSGTGPAYVFLVMEAMVDAAVHLGFARYVAKKLVFQTVLGSVLFAEQSGKHLAELRNMVTSPGGTSADAIYQMEKGSLRTVLSKAIWGAYQKSCMLANMMPAASGPTRPDLEE